MIPKMMAMTSSESGEVESVVVGELVVFKASGMFEDNGVFEANAVLKASGVETLYGLLKFDRIGVGGMVLSWLERCRLVSFGEGWTLIGSNQV